MKVCYTLALVQELIPPCIPTGLPLGGGRGRTSGVEMAVDGEVAPPPHDQCVVLSDMINNPT